MAYIFKQYSIKRNLGIIVEFTKTPRNKSISFLFISLNYSICNSICEITIWSPFLATLLEYKTEAHVTYPTCYLRHLKISKEMISFPVSASVYTKRSQEPRCLGVKWGQAVLKAAFLSVWSCNWTLGYFQWSGSPENAPYWLTVREIFPELFSGGNWVREWKVYILCAWGSRRQGWAFGAGRQSSRTGR